MILVSISSDSIRLYNIFMPVGAGARFAEPVPDSQGNKTFFALEAFAAFYNYIRKPRFFSKLV